MATASTARTPLPSVAPVAHGVLPGQGKCTVSPESRTEMIGLVLTFSKHRCGQSLVPLATTPTHLFQHVR